MKQDKNHIDFENDFFNNNSVKYSRSKEDVWAEMESKLTSKKSSKVIKVNFMSYLKYGVAAVLVLGLGLLSFLKFYTVNIHCPNGQHSMITLPDGSKVTLNAGSDLAYHPYWWQFSRTIDFSGEAFFQVKKGEKFEVHSAMGSTSVLGTSFNIYARKDEYRVYCISGVVKVETKTKETTVLMKNDYSIVNQNNKIIKEKDENTNQDAVAWIDNEFVFTNMPLKDAYEEVERQYDIKIEGKEHLRGVSTLTAKRNSSPEKIIDMIGRPSGVKCIKISDKKYIVEQK